MREGLVPGSTRPWKPLKPGRSKSRREREAGGVAEGEKAFEGFEGEDEGLESPLRSF